MQLVPGDRAGKTDRRAARRIRQAASDWSSPSEWTGSRSAGDHRSVGVAAGGARPVGPARPRSAGQDGCGRGDGLVRRPAGRGARLRPPSRRAPPRHQAGQHPGESVRPAVAGRLQHLVAARRQRIEGEEMFGGTFAYMSPEHFDAFNPAVKEIGPEAVNEQSDLYSLGIVLRQLLGRADRIGAARPQGEYGRRRCGKWRPTAGSRGRMLRRSARCAAGIGTNHLPLLGAEPGGSVCQRRRTGRAARWLPAAAAGGASVAAGGQCFGKSDCDGRFSG